MAEYYYTNNPNQRVNARAAFHQQTMAGRWFFETDAGVFSKLHIDPGSEISARAR